MMPGRSYVLKERNKSYNSLLFQLFMAGACSRSVLFSPDLTKANIYAVVDKAIKQGHVREGQYREKYGDRFRFQKYLSLTKEGLAYLRSQTFLPWLPYIPQDIPSLTPFPNTNVETVTSTTRSGNSLLMALKAGASITPFFYTGQPDPSLKIRIAEQAAGEPSYDPITFDEYQDGYDDEAELELYERKERSREPGDTSLAPDEAKSRRGVCLTKVRSDTWNRATVNGCPVLAPYHPGCTFFFSRREIRAMLEAANMVGDMKYTKFTGIICNPDTSIILYHAKHDGFGWLNVMERRDSATARRFSTVCSPYDNITTKTVRAGVFVYNAKNFGDIIRNKWHKRSKGTVLGKTFQAVNLIPLGPEGAQLLSALLNNSLPGIVDEAATAIYHATPTPTNDIMQTTFPYMLNDAYLFDGSDMDYSKISRAIYLLEQHEKRRGHVPPYIVLCYRWQMAHYNNVWPGVPFYPIDP